jgi:hypothetical protein
LHGLESPGPLSFGVSKTSEFSGGQLLMREIFSAVSYRTAYGH